MCDLSAFHYHNKLLSCLYQPVLWCCPWFSLGVGATMFQSIAALPIVPSTMLPWFYIAPFEKAIEIHGVRLTYVVSIGITEALNSSGSSKYGSNQLIMMGLVLFHFNSRSFTYSHKFSGGHVYRKYKKPTHRINGESYCPWSTPEYRFPSYVPHDSINPAFVLQ